ncbi:hypothetical protein BDZ89DRAFT_1130294 [Hymenopellis radicata]|nr:hypothetical protein BDZ89DRAFT_1130294 [Hymenopellis radicata]
MSLDYSLYVAPDLDRDAVLAQRHAEARLLNALHWSQDPFDGSIDLPIIPVVSQGREIGYNRLTPNSSGASTTVRAIGVTSGTAPQNPATINMSACAKRPSPLKSTAAGGSRMGRIEKNKRPKGSGFVVLETLWYFHMMRRGRFGLPAPKPLDPSPIVIERHSTLAPPIPPPPPPNSPSVSIQPGRQSRVLQALDQEMESISPTEVHLPPSERQSHPMTGLLKLPPFMPDALDDPSVVSVGEPLRRLDRRKTKVSHPLNTRIPAYPPSPRANPYPLPSPPLPLKDRYATEQRLQRMLTALSPPANLLPRRDHYSDLGSIPPVPPQRAATSFDAESLQRPTSSLSSHTSTSSNVTRTTVLNSPPPLSSTAEWLDRLGSRSGSSASTYDILTACLKRVLPNQAVAGTCVFLADELTASGVQREHSRLDVLESVADRLRKAIAEELTVRRDALRRRESELVSNWEDEYLANARDDKKVEQEVALLLHGRRASPSPPPSPRHECPYFVSLEGSSGLCRPPTSRVGPGPVDEQNSSSVPLVDTPQEGAPNSTRPGSPTPPPHSELNNFDTVDFNLAPPTYVSYDIACQCAMRPMTAPSSPTPVPPSSAPAVSSSPGGPVVFYDDDDTEESTPVPPSSAPAVSSSPGGPVVFYDDDDTEESTPVPPSSAPAVSSSPGGPVVFYDDDVEQAMYNDTEEPDVDVDKVIASSFYQDLARDISVDPSIDRAMVRTLTSLAEDSPEDLLNKCVDSLIEEVE